MNTEELLCVIRENMCLSFVTDDVYSADTLPDKVHVFSFSIYMQHRSIKPTWKALNSVLVQRSF